MLAGPAAGEMPYSHRQMRRCAAIGRHFGLRLLLFERGGTELFRLVKQPVAAMHGVCESASSSSLALIDSGLTQ